MLWFIVSIFRFMALLPVLADCLVKSGFGEF
jgi:hypothetical protein